MPGRLIYGTAVIVSKIEKVFIVNSSKYIHINFFLIKKPLCLFMYIKIANQVPIVKKIWSVGKGFRSDVEVVGGGLGQGANAPYWR